MIHIYSPGLGEESATRLQSHIKEEGAECELHWSKDGDFPKKKGDLVVNWGSTKAKHFGPGAKWLNKVVKADKLGHLKAFEKAGVPTVEYVTSSKPSSGVWYGRLLQHWDGDDLSQELEVADFWVKHVDVKEEYRVHCFRNEVLRASLKVPLPKWTWKGKTYEGKPNPKFRTGDHWGFSSYDYAPGLSKKIRAACVDAVEALGYDFGGVDVATLEDGFVVFEVNSAPWLGGDAATKYAKRIIKIANA